MKVTTDHIFRMGQSHEVCEDYAASFDEPACVILGDGCSVCRGNDGKPVEAHTDFGSRLLVRAAWDVIKEQPHDLKYLHLLTLQKAAMWAKMLGFGRETLSSTLLCAQVQEGPRGADLVTTICGDGVVAVHRCGDDPAWFVFEYTFDPSPPYYVRYELNSADRRLFLIDAPRCMLLRYTLGGNGGDWGRGERVPDLYCEQPSPYFNNACHPCDDFDMVAIFSDGIQSFTQKVDGNPKAVPAKEILPSLLAFKNTNGEFVKRRAKRALADFASNGIHHQDDFSMAVISVQGDTP